MMRSIGLALGVVAMLAWAGCSVDCKICCHEPDYPADEECMTMEGVDKSKCEDCMFETVLWYEEWGAQCDCEEK